MKKNKYLFVDGYNIINYWSTLNKIKDEVSLESARDELINILSEYQSLSEETIILVFDAYLSKRERVGEEQIKNIKVYFTKEKETADQYIERVLDQIGKKNQIRVATSDGLIQQIILGRGGTRLSANELYIEYQSLKNQASRIENTSRNTGSKNIVSINEKNVEQLENYKKKLKD